MFSKVTLARQSGYGMALETKTVSAKEVLVCGGQKSDVNCLDIGQCWISDKEHLCSSLTSSKIVLKKGQK